jgi:hypothetical protein
MAESKEFQGWVRLQHARIAGTIDAEVKAAMKPENILVEYGPFE